jgi:WD40 repeat protein
MATMERRKTLTMNWDGLGDDEDDMHFFETYNRLSTAVPDDLASSSDEDEDYEDSRLSFASAASSFVPAKHRKPELPPASAITPNYDIWMAAPGSITERRRRLLGSMGLDDHKENLKATSDAIGRAITKKFDNCNQEKTPTPASSISVNSGTNSFSSSSTVSATSSGGSIQQNREQSPVQYVLVRSRSEGDIDFFSMAKLRKEEMIGKISKQRLTRTSTEIGVPCTRARHVDGNRIIMRDSAESSMRQLPPMSPVVTPGSGGVGAFFLIKNLDTGKEFIVKEYGENGTWNRLSDLETGKQLTMEEFENTVGHSPFIKDIMRRGNYGRHDGYGKKLASNSVILRSLRLSKRKSASLLKNIKGVASGIVGEREREMAAPQVVEQHQQKKPEGKNKWVKVRQSGKSQKDLSALHLCQEFQAHEGCIWTIKFSLDGRFLASAGEDKVIHVWEVQECEVMSMKPEEGNLTPIHPSLMSSMERGVETQNLGKKKGKFGSKRGGSAAIPEYVHVPENVFTFSEKPYCSFHGHLDEVLDLSWSRSQVCF